MNDFPPLLTFTLLLLSVKIKDLKCSFQAAGTMAIQKILNEDNNNDPDSTV